MAIAAGAALFLWDPVLSAAEPVQIDCVITPSKLTDLSSAVPGLVARIRVDRSDTVKKGQVIALMDSEIERRDLDISRARARMTSEINLNQANLKYDRTNLKRLESLRTSNYASQNQQDIARRDQDLSTWNLLRARDAYKLRQLELLRAREILEQKTIRSPHDGVVVQRFKSQGEYVDNEPIVRLAQLDPLYIETIVPMDLFGKIRLGMLARVIPEGYEEQSYEAQVIAVDKLGDAASGTFGARLNLPNPDNRLPAGLKCLVEFVPASELTKVAPTIEGLNVGSEETGTDVMVRRETLVENSSVAKASIILEIQTGESTAAGATTLDIAPVAAASDAGTFLATAPDLNSEPNVENSRKQDPLSMALCGSVGPLYDSENAAKVLIKLRDEGYGPTLRQPPLPRTIGYILLAPRQGSAQATRDYQRRLAGNGILDVAVISAGAYSGRISLGVYNLGAYAKKRQAVLQRLGFDVELVERSKAEWWIDLNSPLNGRGADRLRETLEPLQVRLGIGAISCRTSAQILASK